MVRLCDTVPDVGVEFIDGSESVEDRVEFRSSLSGIQRRLTGIAGARVQHALLPLGRALLSCRRHDGSSTRSGSGGSEAMKHNNATAQAMDGWMWRSQ
jgi:hypothetical protein